MQKLSEGTFDDNGALTLDALAELRARLSVGGDLSTRMQSRVLAEELEWPDTNVLWSLLMWNTPPPPPLRQRLGRWIEAGMSIRKPVARHRDSTVRLKDVNRGALR